MGYCKDPFLYKVWQVAWLFEGSLWVPFGPVDGDVKFCSGFWKGFGRPSLVTIGFIIKWLPCGLRKIFGRFILAVV